MVEEAGGTLSDFAGGKDYLQGGDIVAAAPPVHREMLAIIRSIFKGERPTI
jgi:myo-inositol-1(or 4)-monophosphatase